jgi:hypothetical protein
MILNHGDYPTHFSEMTNPKCPGIHQWGRTSIEQTITSSTLQILFMINTDFAMAFNGYRTIGLWIPIP